MLLKFLEYFHFQEQHPSFFPTPGIILCFHKYLHHYKLGKHYDCGTRAWGFQEPAEQDVLDLSLHYPAIFLESEYML